jgi:hypothetical protein
MTVDISIDFIRLQVFIRKYPRKPICILKPVQLYGKNRNFKSIRESGPHGMMGSCWPKAFACMEIGPVIKIQAIRKYAWTLLSKNGFSLDSIKGL